MHHTDPYCLTQPSGSILRIQRPVLLFLALIFLALFCLLTMQQAFANEGRSEKTTLASSATLVLSNGNTRTEAIQLDAQMDVSITGLLAQMTLTQSYRNTTDHWMQARYLFPLPEKAAVQGMTINIGDRIIVGKILPRQKARETYEAARDTGLITGLVEQQRPNLFSMDVATVAPQSTISITLTLMLPVDVERQSRRITLPTTHTPRYTNALTPEPTAVDTTFTDNTLSRGPRLSLNVYIDNFSDHNNVSSDTHTLMSDIDSVSLNNVPMDRDVVIRWPANYGDTSSSEIYVSEHHNERYTQLLLNPPAELAPQNRVPRELVIVVDKSGSMAGESMEAARSALKFALRSLDAKDYFNIIAFDDKTQPLFKTAKTASPENLQLAERFVRALDADGGTEMRESLRLALKHNPDTGSNRLKQVIFLTDGSVGYEETLLKDIKQQLGDSRLFTIGIGSAPNHWFLEQAAHAGRGIALKIPDSTAAANAIQSLMTSLVSPVVTDIEVQFIGGHGELYPNPIPDLYADKPQMLVAQLSDSVREVIISGERGHNGELVSWQQRLQIEPVESESNAVPGMKLFWTRLKVASLLDEQRNAIDTELHKDTITQLAVNAQLLTQYTSFVVVDETPSRPLAESMPSSDVASLIPHGNKMRSLAMPQGATGIHSLKWISLILAMTGLMTVIRTQHIHQS